MGEANAMEQYKNISNKLKKRFLRKPNVTEACEAYSQLGQNCEKNEIPAYAGLCWIAAARCEGSLGNIQGETACLIRAARQFVSSEEGAQRLGCLTPSSENLQAALGCYAHASSRFPENNSNANALDLSLNLEVVEALKKLNRNECVENYLKNAVEKSKGALDTHLFCLEALANHYIEEDNLAAALDLFCQMTCILEKGEQNASRKDILLRCEINLVLLLLILKPEPQKLDAKLIGLLEKFTWTEKSDRSQRANGMSEILFILIQSLMLTCQSLDTTCLVWLESELWPHLGEKQKLLIRNLVRMYSV